jgi:post-segregation antitoxin (ccd killing protein)
MKAVINVAVTDNGKPTTEYIKRAVSVYVSRAVSVDISRAVSAYVSRAVNVDISRAVTYNIQIAANNPISTQSVSTTIKIMKAVRNVAVTDNGKPTTENQPKVFDITFEEAGTSTCVNIDYGDGSAEMYGDSATCSGSQYSGSSSYKATFTNWRFSFYFRWFPEHNSFVLDIYCRLRTIYS